MRVKKSEQNDLLDLTWLDDWESLAICFERQPGERRRQLIARRFILWPPLALRHYSARLTGSAQVRLRISTPFGAAKVDAFDFNGFQLAATGGIGRAEIAPIRWLARHLPARGVFYDIGANYGGYAAAVCRLRPEFEVIAFEPNPRVARHARQLLRSSRCEVREVAIGSARSSGELSVSARHTGSSSITNRADRPTDTIAVEVSSIDALIEGGHLLPAVAMKIDVEGHELSVINGSTRFISTYHPYILFGSAHPAGSLGLLVYRGL